MGDAALRSLARFLMLFMAVRLLAPPGICVCELALPLERLIAAAYHAPQPPDHCEEEDPRFGCVVCQLPPAMESKQVPPRRPVLSLDLSPLLQAAFRVVCNPSIDAYQPPLQPTGAALCLSNIPLRI
jgi:hypothetical protein